MNSDKFIGDLLIRAGVVDAASLARGLERQTHDGVTLGRALDRLGLAKESDVASAIAAGLHLTFLDGEPPAIAKAVAALLPVAFCRQRGVAPLRIDGNVLRLAMTNPMDYALLQTVEFGTSKKATVVVVTQSWIERLFRRQDATSHGGEVADTIDVPEWTPAVETAAVGDDQPADTAPVAVEVQSAIVKLVNHILIGAARAGASDVHLEPHETLLQVRQRVDGLLHDVRTIPRDLQDETISRLKIMSGMDISERRKPQDGRSRLTFEGRRIDLRVSTMPTQFGEKIVVRLLNADRAVPALDQIGLSTENLRLFRSFLSNAQGMILVTGPTGSGKTSTLYTALNSIKSSSNNIITLEDPIEMQIPGVNQMQVNPRAGVTFASGLRSILRQDPNVILVGEIRDQETADIALGAAQTGHLLLSTLHTNDATATITRLFDLGIQPFLMASSLLGILAQRLVRRPCPVCAVHQPLSAETIERAGGAARLPADGHWVSGPGCDNCEHTGLKGRIAIHEVLPVTDEVRDLISARAAEHVIKKAARRAGMRTLLDDGIEKAAQGLTTLDEVLKAVSRSDGPERAGDVTSALDATASPAPNVPEQVAGKQGGRVLVVEDSTTVASVIKYFLELEGFEVLLAPNGLIGLEMALEAPPDVIVSDVNMPGMGGVAMVKALRADARTANVRVLMLTSEASVESEAEGLEAGADDYILKPVEPRRLAARVKALRARTGAR